MDALCAVQRCRHRRCAVVTAHMGRAQHCSHLLGVSMSGIDGTAGDPTTSEAARAAHVLQSLEETRHGFRGSGSVSGRARL